MEIGEESGRVREACWRKGARAVEGVCIMCLCIYGMCHARALLLQQDSLTLCCWPPLLKLVLLLLHEDEDEDDEAFK